MMVNLHWAAARKSVGAREMTSILEVISAVAQVREAIASLRSGKGRKEFTYPNEHFARIGNSLSGIYFEDDGILFLLRKIQSGVKLDDNDRILLREFNQREEIVNNHIENLVLDHGRRARNSIQQSRIISAIAGRKVSLREAIQRSINEAITFDKKIDLSEISALIREIELLNDEIGRAEHDLRQFQ